MDRQLRLRILKKLAQTQPQQPAQTTQPAQAVIPPVPAVPPVIYAHLNNGYNNDTVTSIKAITEILNTSLHYASNGKANFQEIMNNNLDLSDAGPDELHIGVLSKMFYVTFLHSRNDFAAKISATQIHTWANAFLSNSNFQSLTQINPTGTLATKVGNLRTTLQTLFVNIQNKNPIQR